MNFNADAIRKNKIKFIDIKVVNKPDGAIIIDKGTSYGYQFNMQGYVTHYYYTVFNKIVMEEDSRKNSSDMVNRYVNDTVFVDVFYNQLNRIICKRVKTDNTYDGYYYEYNEQSQVTKEMHFKETNANPEGMEFKLGTQELISAETYEYKILTPTQIKKKYVNNAGYPYKTTIINYDEKNNIVSEIHEFTVSWLRQEYKYEYDTNRKLLKKTYKSNENGIAVLESVYEYGKDRDIMSEKKYKNGELIFETNYLFDESGKLITSEANRNYKNASILMVKYKYEFY